MCEPTHVEATEQDMVKAKAATKTEKPVIGFKGLDADFKCKNYQFEVGKTYEHKGKVAACESGFHACENPLDVWSYYGPCESRFALVELSGEMSRHEDDSKIAAARIHIKAELSLPDFIKRAVTWMIDCTKSGDRVQSASGDSSKLAASGNYSQLAASGYSLQLAASGNYSQLAASGNYSKLAASGDYSKLAASGYSLQLAASGKNSVIVSASINATAKGADGTWISLAEFDTYNRCVGFADGCIGRDGLKPETWYRASGGKLIAV